MTSKIILPEDVVKAHVEEYVAMANAHLMKEAKKEIDKIKECPTCHRKNELRAIPLREEPTPLPTKFVIYCHACGYNRAMMTRESDKRVKYYEKEIQKIIDKMKTPEELAREKQTVVKDKEVVDGLMPAETFKPDSHDKK
jgi:transcription elongation factor Elf1